MKISEAYLLFGFKDYSGFYKAFRKEYGMSPKEWQETVMNIPEVQSFQIHTLYPCT